MKKNKPLGLCKKRGKYYCRIVSSNQTDILVPLQTDVELDAVQKCRQVNVYRNFLMSGELSVQELTNNTEIAEWFNHSKSQVVPITISRLGISYGVIAALLFSTLWFVAMLRTSEMPH